MLKVKVLSERALRRLLDLCQVYGVTAQGAAVGAEIILEGKKAADVARQMADTFDNAHFVVIGEVETPTVNEAEPDEETDDAEDVKVSRRGRRSRK